MTLRACTCPDKERYCKTVCACCYQELVDEQDRLRVRARRFHAMARNLFELGQEHWLEQIELGRYERASHLTLCGKCGIEYIDHPMVQGFPTFVVTCEGRMWKL